MTWGTPDILISEQLTGGPKLIHGTITAGNGDTTGDIDLSAYLGDKIYGVISVMCFKAAAAHDVDVIDYTTVATTLTLTFADPTADVTFHFTVLGH